MENTFQSFTFSQNFTLSEALDIMLGNRRETAGARATPPGISAFSYKQSCLCREVLGSMKLQPGAEAGRPGSKTHLHPTWISLVAQPAEPIKKRACGWQTLFPLIVPLPTNYSQSLAVQQEPGVMCR